MIRRSVRRRLATIVPQRRRVNTSATNLRRGARRSWQIMVSGCNRMEQRPYISLFVACATPSIILMKVDGMVAGIVGGVYGALGLSSWRSARIRRRCRRERQQSIDLIDEHAAILRAGISAPLGDRVPDDSTRVSVVAAYHVSERLGAPLAELFERIDRDLRARQRIHSEIAAQMAGARATTALLAVLPLAGIMLGESLGVDPLHQLLHTEAGAICAILALVMQCGGLLLTARIVRLTSMRVDR